MALLSVSMELGRGISPCINLEKQYMRIASFHNYEAILAKLPKPRPPLKCYQSSDAMLYYMIWTHSRS